MKKGQGSGPPGPPPARARLENILVIVPSYFWQGKYGQDLKIFGEKDHFGNIVNIRPAHVPFIFVFIGL